MEQRSRVVDVELLRLRVDLNGAADHLDSVGRVAALQAQDAEQVPGVGGRRAKLQDLAIAPLGKGDVARQMGLVALGQEREDLRIARAAARLARDPAVSFS